MIENSLSRTPGNYDRLLDFSRAVDRKPVLSSHPRPSGILNDDAPATAMPVEGSTFELVRLRPGVRWFARSGLKGENPDMNNLHHELARFRMRRGGDIEEETTRTHEAYLAGVGGRTGAWSTSRARAVSHSAVGRKPRDDRAAGHGISRGERSRRCEVRVTVRARSSADRTTWERGAGDSDWQPAKDAAQKIAYAEDRVIFEGHIRGGHISWHRQCTAIRS